jgi:hypothetical protein
MNIGTPAHRTTVNLTYTGKVIIPDCDLSGIVAAGLSTVETTCFTTLGAV